MYYYFTREGLRQLDKELQKVQERIDQAAAETGEACQEGGDTWHDNFGYEEGVRQQTMWSRQLRDLNAIRSKATVVDPPTSGDEVAMGRTVVYQDQGSGEIHTVKIGSYMVFDGEMEISYMSSLSALLRGGRTNDVRTGMVGDAFLTVKILAVR